MAEAAERRMTVSEFLAWDSGDDRRHELIDGVPVAMAPASRAHGALAGALAGLLFPWVRARAGCVLLAEAGIVCPDRQDTWYQADLAVMCRPKAGDDAAGEDPVALIEILSPTTQDHDRRRKLPDYRALAPVREIVLVDSQAMFIEVHRRQPGDGWVVDLLRRPEDVLVLESIGARIGLGDLYRDIPLDA